MHTFTGPPPKKRCTPQQVTVQAGDNQDQEPQPGKLLLLAIYRIRSIRRCDYYLFHRPTLCGIYSRAVIIREQHLLIPVAARKSIRREKVAIDTTELGDSGLFVDVEED